MNIFLFNKDLSISAKYFFSHDPNRARKQIVESLQMISTACYELGFPVPLTKAQVAYKPSNVNSPLGVWTRKEIKNFIWHVDYFSALCVEYSRINHREHACWQSWYASSHSIYTAIEILYDPNTIEPLKTTLPPFIGLREFCKKPNRINSADCLCMKCKKYLANKQGKELKNVKTR